MELTQRRNYDDTFYCVTPSTLDRENRSLKIHGRSRAQLSSDVWCDFPRVGGLILNEAGVASLSQPVRFPHLAHSNAGSACG
jgi:hypothetical protein